MLLLYFTFFFTMHFNLLTSIIATVLSQAANIPIQILLYDESPESACLLFLFNMLWLLPMMLLCQGMFNSAGFLFADTEMKSQGNTQLLEDLEEGLVVLEENETLQVLFFN